MTTYERKNTQLIALFDELTRRRPDLLGEIPSSVALVMQIDGDEEFNRWAREVAEHNSPDRPKLLVVFRFAQLPPKKAPAWEDVQAWELQPA